MPSGYIFKTVPPNALKMHSVAVSTLKFICKTFSKLIKFALQNTIPLRWLLKNSYIQKQNFYVHKVVRAAKKQNLKSVIWVPDFGCPGWYIGLANSWHMSLTFFKGDTSFLAMEVQWAIMYVLYVIQAVGSMTS